MNVVFPFRIYRGIVAFIIFVRLLFSQDIPTILSSKVQSIEKGLKIEFAFSSYVEKADVSSWIEQDNWFIINFYRCFFFNFSYFFMSKKRIRADEVKIKIKWFNH